MFTINNCMSYCDNINNCNLTCQRRVGNQPCGEKIYETPFCPYDRCIKCSYLCNYEENGITCSSERTSSFYCSVHLAKTQNEKNMNTFKKAVEFHKNYVYCGFHFLDMDDDEVYHYISKKTLGDRSITEIDTHETEIWVDEDIWAYCGPNWERKLSAVSDRYN